MFTCCVCESFEFCRNCFKEFKNGENYYGDESCKNHLVEHPILISDYRWGLCYRVHEREVEFYKETSGGVFSYLYQPKL